MGIPKHPARVAAERANEEWYFTGKPCKRGHTGKRRTVNAACHACELRCIANRPLRGYQRKKRTPEEWARDRTIMRKRLLVNPEQLAAHRAKKAARERARRARADKGIRAAERRARQAAQLQRTPKWADLKAIRAIYRKASKMTRETVTPYQVDHIFPLLGELVSGLHVAENLQVITKQENLLKGSKFEP